MACFRLRPPCELGFAPHKLGWLIPGHVTIAAGAMHQRKKRASLLSPCLGTISHHSRVAHPNMSGRSPDKIELIFCGWDFHWNLRSPRRRRHYSLALLSLLWDTLKSQRALVEWRKFK